MLLKNKFIRFLIIFLIIGLLFIGSTLLASIIIVKTDISESLGGLFMTIIIAICSLLFSMLLTVSLNIKGIYCTVISMCTIIFAKIMITICNVGTLTLTGQGIVGMIFTVIFCLLGTVMGVYIKK